MTVEEHQEPALESATGARQYLTVIIPVDLVRTPDMAWAPGPLPLRIGDRVTDAATRSTYFTLAAARALYGAPGRPCRWHRMSEASNGPLHLDGVELLRTATPRHKDRSLAVLHLTIVGPELLNMLRAIHRRATTASDPLTGPLDPAVLLAGVADIRSDIAPFGATRRYAVAFLSPTVELRPALRPTADAPVPASADRWLWQLAAGVSSTDFPIAPETAADLSSGAIRISADWSAQVLRQGAAFLGHRADQGDGDFYRSAAAYTRTVYLDALLLGSVQRDHIEELTDELSGVFDRPRIARQVTVLERYIAHFRSTYWREHLTAHGPANDLLLAFHAQHRLSARFDEILAESADYSRLVQTLHGQQISGALGVLTILGLPLATALSILPILGGDSIAHLLVALGAALVVTAAILGTRYGRLVLASLRSVGVSRNNTAPDSPE